MSSICLGPHLSVEGLSHKLAVRWLSSVVLPAPRKPESTVTGSGPAVPASRRSSCASRTAVYGADVITHAVVHRANVSRGAQLSHPSTRNSLLSVRTAVGQPGVVPGQDEGSQPLTLNEPAPEWNRIPPPPTSCIKSHARAMMRMRTCQCSTHTPGGQPCNWYCRAPSS